MESLGGPWLPQGKIEKKVSWDPRYLYSYFALTGTRCLSRRSIRFPTGILRNSHGPASTAFGCSAC